MKRSRIVQLTLVAAIAAGLSSCRRNVEPQRCVDKDGNVVLDRYCDEWDRQPYRPGYIAPYRWYYGGSGFRAGERAFGGSFFPTPGMSAARSSSSGWSGFISRGGFGSSSVGHTGG